MEITSVLAKPSAVVVFVIKAMYPTLLGILLFIASSAFLFWPIRYIIKAITFKFYSLNRLGRELKQFDEG